METKEKTAQSKKTPNPKKLRLNELGRCWNPKGQVCDALTEVNRYSEAEKLTIWTEICKLALEIYYRDSIMRRVCEQANKENPDTDITETKLDFARNAFLKALEEAQRLFKPWDDKKEDFNNLSAFLTCRTKYRYKTFLEEEIVAKQSLDSPSGGENSENSRAIQETVGDWDFDTMWIDEGMEQNLDRSFIELASAILNFTIKKNKYGTETVNVKRRRCYRMIFTNEVVQELKKAPRMPRFQHRRDIYKVMKRSYLRFIMRDAVTSLEETYRSPLKLYGEVVDAASKFTYDPREQIPLPVPQIVPASFLFRSGEYKTLNSAKVTFSTAVDAYQKDMGTKTAK